jgi:hypothetical protein
VTSRPGFREDESSEGEVLRNLIEPDERQPSANDGTDVEEYPLRA